MFYPRAFSKVFGQGKRKYDLRTEHKVVNTRKTGKTILLQGIILQHNFIEAHTTTGQIPAELANLKLDLGVNRWLGLIRLATKSIKINE